MPRPGRKGAETEPLIGGTCLKTVPYPSTAGYMNRYRGVVGGFTGLAGA